MPQTQASNRLAAGSALALLTCTVVGGFEGLRQNAYPDPASHGYPWTVCYGHASHVSPGEHHSLGECKQLLLADLQTYAKDVDRCIEVDTGDSRYVALLSLAYNIGPKTFCNSSLVRDLNNCLDVQACNDFLKYDKAAGVTFPGLTRRRESERQLCLENT